MCFLAKVSYELLVRNFCKHKSADRRVGGCHLEYSSHSTLLLLPQVPQPEASGQISCSGCLPSFPGDKAFFTSHDLRTRRVSEGEVPHLCSLSATLLPKHLPNRKLLFNPTFRINCRHSLFRCFGTGEAEGVSLNDNVHFFRIIFLYDVFRLFLFVFIDLFR